MKTTPIRPAKQFVLLLSTAVVITTSLLFLCPASAHAQGGVPLWTNRYNGPANGDDRAFAIAVDSSGNVFVTGESYRGSETSSSDYATVAYSNAGMTLWTNQYNGPANGWDVASAIAVDSSGHVFVTGLSASATYYDHVTINYSSAGTPLWTNRFPAAPCCGGTPTIAMDSNGNVLVTGPSTAANSFPDYATIKYSNEGVPLWTNRYDGPENVGDFANAIAVDNSGNVFVTGTSYAAGGNGDYTTVGYSNTGVPLWTNRYDGPANGTDGASAIEVDSDGNVFVTGGSSDSSGFGDYATIKYSSTGIPLWTNRYSGPANGGDGATAIAVDKIGNVVVTGQSVGSGTGRDYATIKYSNAGVPLWTRRYNNSDDAASAIAVDSSGNVFVTGGSADSINSDSATVAYSSTGAPLWTNRYKGGLYRIVVDSIGNVFATGWSWNGTNYDFVTIKYSSSVSAPRLDFQRLNNDLVLSWTNAGFNLQSASAVTGTFTNLPGATSPFTNMSTGAQQFFRLVQ